MLASATWAPWVRCCARMGSQGQGSFFSANIYMQLFCWFPYWCLSSWRDIEAFPCDWSITSVFVVVVVRPKSWHAADSQNQPASRTWYLYLNVEREPVNSLSLIMLTWTLVAACSLSRLNKLIRSVMKLQNKSGELVWTSRPHHYLSEALVRSMKVVYRSQCCSWQFSLAFGHIVKEMSWHFNKGC